LHGEIKRSLQRHGQNDRVLQQPQRPLGEHIVPGNALQREDREEIQAGLSANESFTDIAKSLGRSPSTISREVGKNGGRKSYRASSAQEGADGLRLRPKDSKLALNQLLCDEVARRLRVEKLSPYVISRQLANEGFGLVSHETIYSSIYAQGTRGLPSGLHKSLHRHHRCRKPRTQTETRTTRSSPLAPYNRIHDRPAIATKRTEVGHFEGDLILGAANGSAVVTLIDRASYFCLLGELPFGHDAGEVLFALTTMFDRIPPELRKTLTWDQGREMTRHAEMSNIVDIKTYFCDPHSPWQRPSNENFNGTVRRWLPKGTDLSVHSQADLDVIANRINAMPRRLLDHGCALDRYADAVVALTA
jgi:IS30 family transposase